MTLTNNRKRGLVDVVGEGEKMVVGTAVFSSKVVNVPIVTLPCIVKEWQTDYRML